MATLVYNKPDIESEVNYFNICNLSYVKRTLYNEINPENYLIESYGCRLYSPTHNELKFENGDILYIDSKHDLSYIKDFLSETDYSCIKGIDNDSRNYLVIKYNNNIYIYRIAFDQKTDIYSIYNYFKRPSEIVQIIVLDFILQSYIYDEVTGLNHLIKIGFKELDLNLKIYAYECLDKDDNTYLMIDSFQSISHSNIDVKRIHSMDSLPRLYSNFTYSEKQERCPDFIINIEETFINNKRIPVKDGILIVDWYSFINSPNIFNAPIEPKYRCEYAIGLICNGYYIESSHNTIDILDSFKKSAETIDVSTYSNNIYDRDKATNEKIKETILDVKSKLFFDDILRKFPSIIDYYPSFAPRVIMDSRGYIIDVLKNKKKDIIDDDFDIDGNFKIMLGQIDRGTDDRVNSWISVFNKPFNGIKTEAPSMDIYNKLNLEFPYLKEANLFVAKHIAVCQKTNRYTRIPPVILNGTPGIGKTKWAKRVAELCGIKSHFKNMAGIASSIDIIGAERGWGTTRPGFWAYGIRDTGISNPLMILDEIDKMSISDMNGDPYGALLSFLENETSSSYYDVCLQTRFDLSLISYVMTANRVYNVPEVFLSRATIIQCRAPTEDEIHNIFPNLVKDVKLTLGLPDDYYVDMESLKEIKDDYRNHQSIRRIKKNIEDIIVDDIFYPDKIEAVKQNHSTTVIPFMR